MKHLEAIEKNTFELSVLMPDHLRKRGPKAHLTINLSNGNILLADDENAIACGPPDEVIHILRQLIGIAEYAKGKISTAKEVKWTISHTP